MRPRSRGSLGLDAQVAVNQNLGVLGPGPLRGPDLQQGDTTVGVNVLAISREFALAQVNGSSERPWDVVFEPNTLFSIAYVPHGVDPAHVQATLGVAADILHRKVNRWLDAHVVQAQLFGGVDVPLGGGPSLPIVGGQLGSSAEVALPDDEGREPSERVTLTVGGAAQIQSVGGVPSAALLLNVTLTVHVLRDHGEP